MKRSAVYLLLAAAAVWFGCEDKITVEEPGGGGDDETISQPYKPFGESLLDVDSVSTYVTGGAASSLGHAVRYRFDLDADGVHSYTAWSDTDTVAVSWPDSGVYSVRAQASCADHGDVVSEWSQGKTVWVGTVAVPPEIRFATHIDGVTRPYHPAAALDTVGMLKPFSISYHGLSVLGVIEAYKFYPLTGGVTLPGQDEWTTDLSDTLRSLPNTGPGMLPSGVFKLAARCRDPLGNESVVDAGTFQRGVAQVVVNFDPDTRITHVLDTYTVSDGAGGTTVATMDFDFTDGLPDTVPYDSWLRIDYLGWDDPRDGMICAPTDLDRCMGFQVAYHIESVHYPYFEEFSLWQPRGGLHETNPASTADSNTFHIGSLEYELFVRSVDENGRPDGMPASVELVGNFDPSLDEVAVEDHLGNQLDLSVVDTLTWNFWKGEGWPYVCDCDTLNKQRSMCEEDQACQGKLYPGHTGTYEFVKSWSFHIKASGHDHPKDPPPSLKDPLGSGIKSWRYRIMNAQGQFITLGHSSLEFFEYTVGGQIQINVLDDVIRWRVLYPSPYTGPPTGDPYGCTVFDKLPAWMNQELTVFLVGKDTAEYQVLQFNQGIFINGLYETINVFPDRNFGRRTPEAVFAFVVRMVRPGPPDACP